MNIINAYIVVVKEKISLIIYIGELTKANIAGTIRQINYIIDILIEISNNLIERAILEFE